MKYAVIALSILAFAAGSARADKIVDLNSKDLTIDNQAGETIVLRRTQSTPDKIKIQMNPVTHMESYCESYDSSEHCSPGSCDSGNDNSGSGGDNGHAGGCTRVQGPDGIWRDDCWSVLMPISMMGGGGECCSTSSTCSSYGERPVSKYGKFEIRFKDNLLAADQVDELQLVPIDQKSAKLAVLKSLKPYQVKVNGGQNKFELKQK